MSLFDGKFITNIPASNFFSSTEVTLTRNRINWSLGNSFRRVISGGEQRFKFESTENRRQIYLVVENTSLTESAVIYFPPGFWENGVAVSELDADSRMLLRIISQNGNFYYQVIDDMTLFTPPAPTTDSGLLNVQPFAATIKTMAFDNVESNALYLIQGSGVASGLGAVRTNFATTSQVMGLTFEKDSVGDVDPLVTKFLSDTRIGLIILDEANERAYVGGLFASRFNQSTLAGGTQYSIVEVDLTDGSFSLVVGGLTLFNNNEVGALVGDLLIIQNAQSGDIAAYDKTTGALTWSKVAGAPNIQVPFANDGTSIYAVFQNSYDGVSFGVGRYFIAKINPLTGALDASFVTAQGTGANNLIYGLVLTASGFFVGGRFLDFNGAVVTRLVLLTLAGARDLAVTGDTGPASDITSMKAGPAGFLYVVASTGNYLNAGAVASGTGVGVVYRVSIADGFAQTFALPVSGTPSNAEASVLYDGTDLFVGSSNNFSAVGLPRVSKLDPLSGAIVALYSPAAFTCSFPAQLLNYTDKIIVGRLVDEQQALASRGQFLQAANNETTFIKLDMATRQISATNTQINTTPLVIKSGQREHNDKIFVGYNATNDGIKVFSKVDMTEIPGYPNLVSVASQVSVFDFAQDGNFLYAGGQFSQVNDGVLQNIAGLVRIDLTTKLVDLEFGAQLPITPLQNRAIVKIAVYGDTVFALYNNTPGAVIQTSVVSVLAINKKTGELYGNFTCEIPTIRGSLAFIPTDKGLVLAQSDLNLGIDSSFILLSNEDGMPVQDFLLYPRIGGATNAFWSYDELNTRVKGMNSQTFYYLNLNTGAISSQALPPVSTAVGGITPFASNNAEANLVDVNVSSLVIAGMSPSTIFDNKRRFGMVLINNDLDDLVETANILTAPTSISIAEGSLPTAYIKRSYQAPLTITRSNLQAYFTLANPVTEGISINPLTGRIEGTPSLVAIDSYQVEVQTRNSQGAVTAAPLTLNVEDRAPWRNLAVNKAGGGASIYSTLEKNDVLHVGGDFSHIGPVFNGLARISPAGALNTEDLARLHDFNGIVTRLLLDGNSLYAFGDFTKYGEFNYPYFLKINLLTGEADHSFMAAYGAGLDDFTSAQERVVYGQILGNTLYLAGSFTTYQGSAVGSVVAINKTTAVIDAAFTAGATVGGNILDMVYEPIENKLWIVGSFASFAGNANASRLAVLSPVSGVLDTSYFGSAAFDATARSIITQSGFMYVGGDFSTYQGISENNLVKLDADTGVAVAGFSKFAAGATVVRRLAVSNTTLMLTSENGVYDTNAIDGALSVDTTNGNLKHLFPTDAPALSVNAVSSNVFSIGGEFLLFDAQATQRLAIANGDTGATVQLFDGEQFCQQKPIMDLLVYSSEYLIANSDAWELSACNGLARFAYSISEGLVRDTAFPQLNSSGITYVLRHDFTSGQIFIGGDFTTVGVTARNNLAKINATTGAHDGTFSIGTGFNARVRDIVFLNISRLLTGIGCDLTVVGAFTDYNGTLQNYITSLNAQTGVISPVGTGTNGEITKAEKIPGALSAVFLGSFTNFGGTPSPGIAVGSLLGVFEQNFTGITAPLGFSLDPLGYVYIYEAATLYKYSPQDGTTVISTEPFVAANPVYAQQGDFGVLVGDLGSTLSYDGVAIPDLTMLAISGKNLVEQSTLREFDVPSLGSGGGSVLSIAPHLGTMRVSARSLVAKEIPFIDQMYGNLIRLSKRGVVTPYND